MLDEPRLDPRLLQALIVYRNDSLEFEVSLLNQLYQAGANLIARGCFADAQACFRVARDIAEKDGHEAQRLSIVIGLARTFLEKSPKYALTLLSAISLNDLKHDMAITYLSLLGSALRLMGKYAFAQDAYRSGLDLATYHKNHALAAIIQANQALCFFETGRMDLAAIVNRQACDALLKYDHESNAGLVLCNMAQHDMLRNRYDNAMEALERSLSLLKQTNNIKLAAFIELNAGEFELLNGNLDDAVVHWRLAKKHADGVPLPSIQLQCIAWKSIIEENMRHHTLIDSLAASSRDLMNQGFWMEAANIAILARSLRDSERVPTGAWPSFLDSVMIQHPQADLLRQHYGRMIASSRSRMHSAPTKEAFPEFLTKSTMVRETKEKLSRLTDTDVRILLEGESGTGKTFLARLIHDAARKHGTPFVVVDCTNLEENLFESKLFGHLRGSFTGAVADTIGLVEQANGGTLFLDEIGELPTEIQAKLLYTIEEQRYRPVGAKSERRAEFRVVAATNRDVDQMLADGRLRNDLFFRMAGFRVHLPPIRERREDIIPLTEARLAALNFKYGRRKKLRSDVWEALIQYSWPGNVRELNATLERGYHLSLGRLISIDDLGLTSLETTVHKDLSWYLLRREHLLKVLRLCKGNVSRAAKMLGLNRTTLIYKLKLLDIDRKDFDERMHVKETTEKSGSTSPRED